MYAVHIAPNGETMEHMKLILDALYDDAGTTFESVFSSVSGWNLQPICYQAIAYRTVVYNSIIFFL